MILVDCYTIMDLGQGIDDIVTGIETVLMSKDLEVTAMIIELEYMDLILFYLYMHMVCGKAYKSFTWCHNSPSGLDIVFNS
jgi:response regulator of citrate/malate metabolism